MGFQQRMMNMMMGRKSPEDVTKMMKEMMPHALSHLLPKMPNEMRVDFILNMTGILMEQGSVEMSEKEKEELLAKIIEKVKA